MPTSTTNYGWQKPDIGASTDAWGGLLNTDLDGIDSTVKSVSNVANAALPSATAGTTYVAKAGDTMTGNLAGTTITLTGATGLTAPQITVNGAAGTERQLFGKTAGVARWYIDMGDATAEGGSNSGSNWKLNSCTDAGAYLSTPLTINRANGSVTTSAFVSSGTGWLNRSGSGGSTNAGNLFNIDFAGSASHLWIDGTNSGQIAFTSDYRIKKDVAPLDSTWDRVKALNPISYTHQDFTPPVELQRDADAKPMIVGDDIERWGFVAHELQETLIPSAATGEKDSPTHIQSPNPWTVIATLTKALQEAMTRIEALEAARG